MTTTIGNPLSWSVDAAKAAGEHLGAVAGTIGGEKAEEYVLPEVRRIEISDLRTCLRKGVEDFAESRTDVIFLCLLYPVIGITLTWIGFDRDLVPLLFPVISGFALIGPVAAVGLYEISRRRELGQPTSWGDAFNVVKSPSFGAIFVLGLMLGALFLIWLLAANGIYGATLGRERPDSVGAFFRDVLTTGPGWAMIVIGTAVGFIFAALVLATSAVSFTLLLDRPVGLPVAVLTSIRVAELNPVPIAVWGLIVTGGLVLGSIPVFLGLIVVLPILGHATWHLYRATVLPPRRAPRI